MLYNDDCLNTLPTLPAASVDLVLTDLPYGITNNNWDSVIPLDALWKELLRVGKPNTAYVFTAMQPFSSLLVTSQPKMFKYEWIWDKRLTTGFLNAKKQPLRRHESVLVFYAKQPTYNPQFVQGKPYTANSGAPSSNYGTFNRQTTKSDGKRYPTSIIAVPRTATKGEHPTQKPVKLMEYLVCTYSNPNDLVLDCAMGSGTTCVAAKNLNRRYIGIERDKTYFDVATDRLK